MDKSGDSKVVVSDEEIQLMSDSSYEDIEVSSSDDEEAVPGVSVVPEPVIDSAEKEAAEQTVYNWPQGQPSSIDISFTDVAVCDKSDFANSNSKDEMSLLDVNKIHKRKELHKCGKHLGIFADSPNLKSHIRIYNCDLRRTGITQVSNLAGLKRIHKCVIPHKCSVCGKSFSWDSHLQIHMRIHTGEQPYNCELCCRRFAQKSTSLRHQRIHNGEKPHKCEVCGRGFAEKSNSLTHQRIHNGEKPYQCEVCGRGFAWVNSLTMHKRTHIRYK